MFFYLGNLHGRPLQQIAKEHLYYNDLDARKALLGVSSPYCYKTSQHLSKKNKYVDKSYQTNKHCYYVVSL